MKTLLIVAVCLFCASCGVKDDPEYQSLKYYKSNINIT